MKKMIACVLLAAALILETGTSAFSPVAFAADGSGPRAEETVSSLRTYMDAAKAFEAGDYASALELFESLNGKYGSQDDVLEAKYAYAGRLAVTGEPEKARELYSEIKGYRDAEAILADEAFWGVRAQMLIGVYDEYLNPLFFCGGAAYQNDPGPGQALYVVLRLTNETHSDIPVTVRTERGEWWSEVLLEAGKMDSFIYKLGKLSTSSASEELHVKWYVNDREKLDSSFRVFTSGNSPEKEALESFCANIRADVQLAVYGAGRTVSGKRPFADALEEDEFVTTQFTLANVSDEDVTFMDNELMAVVDGEAFFWNGVTIKAKQSENMYITKSDMETHLTAGAHTYTVYLKGIVIAQGEYEGDPQAAEPGAA